MRPITDRLSPLVKGLVIANALLFTFYAMVKPAKPFFEEHLALGPGLLAGELWQPVSALFVHLEPLAFFFNLIGLWFVGAMVERAIGTRRFLSLFLVSGVAANVATGLVSAALGRSDLFAGCGPAILALIVAFGAQYDRTPSRILGGLVLEARMLALILVGFSVLVDLSRGAWAALAGNLIAIVLGYLLAARHGQLRGIWSSMRAKRSRRRYQVIEGGRSGRPPSRPTYLN
jgi:membrane associated rhomboid family serine protease